MSKIDAMRVYELSLEELEFLWQKVLWHSFSVSHGLNAEHERYFCINSGRSLSPKGYVNGIDLPLGEKKRRNYVAGQIILAGEGKLPDSPEMTCSHLCDNTWCVRASHLIWESHHANQTRRNCRGEILHEGQLVNACPHTPRCIIGKYNFKI